MADDHARKPVKVGVKEGAGPPPGYKWNVDLLDQSHREAMGILTEEQYDHVSRQFRELATEDEPSNSPTVDVRPFNDLFELRDKGGILGKINIRVFFAVCRGKRTLVVLGTINKKNDGKTPGWVAPLMRYRLRKYLASN
ncbi:hypothetical protein [Gemmata sp.]|uniref:hypothetical protein n=1 Tax=Gemmata sp. TaxID=1914242 RepID=UPI003F706127